MYIKLTSCLLFCALAMACTRSNDAPAPTPNPNPNPAPAQDTIVKKIVIKSPGFPADSSLFTYDAGKRLVREVFNGDYPGGIKQVITDIQRNASGIITGYTRTYANAAGTVTLTENAVIRYDASTSRYTNKVVRYTPAVSIAAVDSTLYTYNGSNLVKIFRYAKATAASAYDSAYRVSLTYGSGAMYQTDAWRYTSFNGWFDNKKFDFAFDTKKNPLFAPELGLLVGFAFNGAEDDNFDWNYAAVNSLNIRQTVTHSGQFATFIYTYNNNNYPVTRTYSDISGPINTVSFGY
jgi:hypothetical protein